jgi:hypothetical protein
MIPHLIPRYYACDQNVYKTPRKCLRGLEAIVSYLLTVQPKIPSIFFNSHEVLPPQFPLLALYRVPFY